MQGMLFFTIWWKNIYLLLCLHICTILFHKVMCFLSVDDASGEGVSLQNFRSITSWLLHIKKSCDYITRTHVRLEWFGVRKEEVKFLQTLTRWLFWLWFLFVSVKFWFFITSNVPVQSTNLVRFISLWISNLPYMLCILLSTPDFVTRDHWFDIYFYHFTFRKQDTRKTFEAST